MNAGVGGKIIKLKIESGFSRGVLANCIYEREREWRGRGLFEGWGGVFLWEKVQFFWAVTVPMLINSKDVVTFILGNLSPVF